MKNEHPELKQTLRRLLGPAEPEVGCDVCFEQLDRYVELELAGEDADRAIPGLRPPRRLSRLPRRTREPPSPRPQRPAALAAPGAVQSRDSSRETAPAPHARAGAHSAEITDTSQLARWFPTAMPHARTCAAGAEDGLFPRLLFRVAIPKG